ncbi:hypothetical protein SRS16CHR_02177 [Variovorax sp. SRS16]|nr:hypothetical protein [Variovorax sp. SRS16]VTU18164.1 hypothetical protein SRS16CHR_02177 [Variovorax sp. SRS16]
MTTRDAGSTLRQIPTGIWVLDFVIVLAGIALALTGIAMRVGKRTANI